MMGSETVEYIGKDLEAMDLAENYRAWMKSFFLSDGIAV